MSDRSDKLLSPAIRKEREAEAARNRKIKIYLGGGLLLVVIVVSIIFFSGSGSDSGSQTKNGELAPDAAEAATLSSIEGMIADGDTYVNDPNASAGEKARWKKDRVRLEKQRDEILKKRQNGGKK
ncbi:MAG TPA: hypothetical protein VGJ05_20910 [Fimbriiglobus sp.]|jgi:hypothetical protein